MIRVLKDERELLEIIITFFYILHAKKTIKDFKKYIILDAWI